MNELQISLIALGGAALVGILAYNKWQERRHRTQAERAFRSEHPDVLLQPQGAAGVAVDRLEPTIEEEPETIIVTEPEPQRVEAEPLPDALADERGDCLVRLEAGEPIAAHALVAAQRDVLGDLGSRVRLFGWNEDRAAWEAIGAHSVTTYRQIVGALQLADRGGPLREEDLGEFIDGLQRIADRFLAVSDPPERGALLERAEALDRFCAGVDVQIGVNLVSRDAAGFGGTKLRGIAEANGFRLASDGSFHWSDDQGRVLFTLYNLEAALFTAEELKTLTTHGLSISLDVPRVAEGAKVFDRMIVVARQVAVGLGAALVDDNRAPFSEASLALIRDKIGEYQSRMAEHGVPAGGHAALRLFS
jgi:FtsZ-interacting cell division protein ZipA